MCDKKIVFQRMKTEASVFIMGSMDPNRLPSTLQQIATWKLKYKTAKYEAEDHVKGLSQRAAIVAIGTSGCELSNADFFVALLGRREKNAVPMQRFPKKKSRESSSALL